jgi:hypothetical protein
MLTWRWSWRRRASNSVSVLLLLLQLAYGDAPSAELDEAILCPNQNARCLFLYKGTRASSKKCDIDSSSMLYVRYILVCLEVSSLPLTGHAHLGLMYLSGVQLTHLRPLPLNAVRPLPL